ncbi:SHOCT domain-containing protein [Levilactobacillus brevis]|nr:SHOCT domain-containing protein [Levilactobacillus brevis]
MLNSLIDTSQILFEKTGDSDYSIRQYIGDTAFETLFVQLKNGQIEYYLLDDPNFLNLTNDKGTKDIAETSDVSSISPVSPTDEIRKYKELLDDGIITQDDFDKKKKQLLGI